MVIKLKTGKHETGYFGEIHEIYLYDFLLDGDQQQTLTLTSSERMNADEKFVFGYYIKVEVGLLKIFMY